MAVDTALPSELRPPFALHTSSPFFIRRASMLDLDAVVEVVLAAMPGDPQWNWRLPYRHEFPDDEVAFTRAKYEQFLNSNDRWCIMVAEALQKNSPPTIVSFAVWDLANVHAFTEQSGHKCLDFDAVSRAPAHIRRDAHPERMKAWNTTTAIAKKLLFDLSLGQSYIQLQVLGTRPEWQGYGAATSLCRWGMEYIKLFKISIAVLASPMGVRLYRRLGFHEILDVKIQTDHEDESVKLVAMLLPPMSS